MVKARKCIIVYVCVHDIMVDPICSLPTEDKLATRLHGLSKHHHQARSKIIHLKRVRRIWPPSGFQKRGIWDLLLTKYTAWFMQAFRFYVEWILLVSLPFIPTKMVKTDQDSRALYLPFRRWMTWSSLSDSVLQCLNSLIASVKWRTM